MRKLVFVATGAVLVGFAVGALAVNAISPPPDADARSGSTEIHVAQASSPRAYDTPTPATGVKPGSDGINEAGVTYGYDAGPTQPHPDLVEAIATNGLIGYYYAADLEKALGASAELSPGQAASQWLCQADLGPL